MKKLMILKYVFEIILIISFSFIYYLMKPIETPRVIYIPNGSINQIIAQMQAKNYDICKLDSLLIRFIGSPQSGWVNMTTQRNTKADFLYKLTTAKAALVDITLIPGETSYIFLKQLAEKLQLNRAELQREFQKQSSRVEGVFVPNTYKIPKGMSEKALIALLLKLSSMETIALSNKIFGTYNETKWFRYVAVASIIQKESANIEEMPLVSSVIYNRLEKGMKLQMDGTLNYGKYSHIKVTAKRIKEDSSEYNTYLNKGVPLNPVCNVSFDALRSAIFPAKTNYLYFMKNKRGVHDFSCNYSTHLANIRRATK